MTQAIIAWLHTDAGLIITLAAGTAAVIVLWTWWLAQKDNETW